MTTIYNAIRTIRRRRKTALDRLHHELALWSKPQREPRAALVAVDIIARIKKEIADIENHRVNFCD